MKRIAIAVLVTGFVVVLGCVRIPAKFEAHITVDIRQHIEQQAASTLDFIEGKTDSLPGRGEAPPRKKASWRERAWDVLTPMPMAYAAELKASSPEIAQIAAELRKRNDQIQGLKTKGIVGENNRGYLDMRPAEALTDPNQRNEAQRLVAAENKDRKALYQEVARLNKDQNVSVSTVERVYAVERLKRAKPGEIFQLPPSGADYDALKASEVGRRLGAQCQPEAWVTIK